MAKYNAMWVGLDRGHEGLWVPSVWYKTLFVLGESDGSNYQDCSDPLYERLKDKVPEVEWVSTEADGRKRGLFRDAREPWDSLNVVSFNENIVSLTEKGRSVCTGILSYSDVLISGLVLHEENDEYPFRIIASAFLETDGRIALTPDLIAGKIMPNYRPLIDDILVTLSAAAEPMPTTQVRRIRNMLQLMSYAGALVKVDSSRYMMANRSVLERIAGGGSVTLKFPLSGCSLQLITYGAPGTGKSDGIERKLRENQIEPIRTTFHPDSDYQSFVGAYKPFMKKIQRVVYVNDGKTAQLVIGPDELKDEEVISYEFRPQSFTEAYVKAWEAMVAGEAKPVVLVIEEINRGDCAKIFGDLFQLLDRDDKTGFSRYPIVADHDLRDYLEKTFGTPAFQACASVEGIDAGVWSDVKVGKKLVLPPNLYIWATMNTSDQSLFPMDSAFKRRWEWKYVPIKNHRDEGWTIDVSGSKKYDWWDFLQKVNKHIFDLTNSEDKQLGYFFCQGKG